MRIALFANPGPTGFTGGTERVVQAQARGLRARGHQVSVESSAGGRLDPGVDIAHVHQWPTLGWDLVRRLSRQVPVVLSLHDHFTSCARSFRHPLAGLRCPTSAPTSACAACVAPLLGEGAPADLEARLVARWSELRAEVLAAAAVLSPSEQLRERLAIELELDPAAWLVVPHGLSQPLTRVRRVRSGDPKLSVLGFGNRASVKGCLDLVEAMAALPPRSARLVLAGEELEAGLDDRLRRAAGSLELELHGRYDARDLARLAAGADLAAFPSRAAESYGLVVEEALALGLPTLVSDRGAYAEVLRANARGAELPGAVLPAESPAAWTRALRALVDAPWTLQDARALIGPRQRRSAEAVNALESIYSGLVRPLVVRRP